MDEKNVTLITNEIINIIKNKFERTEIDINHLNSSIFLRPYYFDALELYELLMIIEEKYNVIFIPRDIKRNGFFSINDIVKLVDQYLHTK